MLICLRLTRCHIQDKGKHCKSRQFFIFIKFGGKLIKDSILFTWGRLSMSWSKLVKDHSVNFTVIFFRLGIKWSKWSKKFCSKMLMIKGNHIKWWWVDDCTSESFHMFKKMTALFSLCTVISSNSYSSMTPIRIASHLTGYKLYLV